MHAVIIGAGFGGLASAAALKQQGAKVRVFERNPELRALAAGVILWPNATGVLHRLGVLDELQKRGSPFFHAQVRSKNGIILSGLDVSSPGGYPALCVHRGDLKSVLRNRLDETEVVFDQTFVSYTEHRTVTTAHFVSGDSYTADLLIGCEGAPSKTRTQIHGEVRPKFSGYCAWRGVAYLDLPDDLQGVLCEYWWRGFRFGVVSMGRGKVCWFATANETPGTPDEPEGRKRKLQKLFRDWAEPILQIISATDDGSIAKHFLRDHPVISPWGKGRVTLVGDAAHTFTPNLGQGACTTLEDAVALAAALRNNGDIETALRTYENNRSRRIRWIRRYSYLFGWVGQLAQPVVADTRDALISIVPGRLFGPYRKKMHNYNPEKDFAQ